MGRYSQMLGRRLRNPLPQRIVEALRTKPDKGQYQGSCNREACQAPGANYFNLSTRRYYCGRCARDINSFSVRADKMILCHAVADETREEIEARPFGWKEEG